MGYSEDECEKQEEEDELNDLILEYMHGDYFFTKPNETKDCDATSNANCSTASTTKKFTTTPATRNSHPTSITNRTNDDNKSISSPLCPTCTSAHRRWRRRSPIRNPVSMLRSGFIPYGQYFHASVGSRTQGLVHDLSYENREEVPFQWLDKEDREGLGPGISHGFVYTTMAPGSVFPIHCEQAGLGALNQIVGVYRPLHLEHLVK